MVHCRPVPDPGQLHGGVLLDAGDQVLAEVAVPHHRHADHPAMIVEIRAVNEILQCSHKCESTRIFRIMRILSLNFVDTCIV